MILASGQSRLLICLHEIIDPLLNAEMVPAREVPSFSTEKGDRFQGTDREYRGPRDGRRIEVGLTLKMAHEESHNESEIDEKGDQHRE
jgi:hypothetical protein